MHRESFGKFNFDGNTLKDSNTITHQKPAISDKSYGKNCDLDNCVSIPFPRLTMLRNNEQNLRQAMLQLRNIVTGKLGHFKHTF